MKYLKLFDKFYFNSDDIDVEDIIRDRLAELDDNGYYISVSSDYFPVPIHWRKGDKNSVVLSSKGVKKIYINIDKSITSSNDDGSRFKIPFSGDDIKDNLESLISVLKESDIILDEFFTRKEGDPVLNDTMYRYFINKEKMETLLPKVLNGLSLMNLKLSFKYEAH